LSRKRQENFDSEVVLLALKHQRQLIYGVEKCPG